MTARILVVDDIAINVRLLEAKLSVEYYDVIAAADGPTALTLAKERAPDLVLLDVMMPGLDGIEVCRRLKADPDTKAIPVIIFTAREHSRGKQLAREMGAADYFPKPFEPDELIRIVEEYAAPVQA